MVEPFSPDDIKYIDRLDKSGNPDEVAVVEVVRINEIMQSLKKEICCFDREKNCLCKYCSEIRFWVEGLQK